MATNVSEVQSKAAACRWRPKAFNIVIAIIVVVLVPIALSTNRFLTIDNAQAILSSAALIGITAVGATLIMIVGSAVSLATAQTAAAAAMVFLATQSLGLGVALLLGLLCGVVVTAVQGVAVGYLEADPIVLTIAANFAIIGIMVLLSGGTPVSASGDAYAVLNQTVLGLPLAVYVLLVLAVATELMLRRTTVGRQMYMVGENRRAARAAGLPVGRVTVVAWVFFGLCTAITGIFMAAFNTRATVFLAGTLTFDTIAAVLVGGTVIAGGRGSVLSTFGGVVLIATIDNLLLLRGYPTGIRTLVQGVIVLIVVVLVHLRLGRAV